MEVLFNGIFLPWLYVAESGLCLSDWYFVPESESFVTENNVNSGGPADGQSLVLILFKKQNIELFPDW